MRHELRRVSMGAGAPPREMRDFLEAPLRRPWLVILPFVFVAGAAVAASFFADKLYKSALLILVELEKVPESFVPQMATESSRQRIYTLKQEILSRTRLERVIRELDPYPQRAGRAPLSAIVENMRRDITINIKGNDAFSIEYVHTDPEKAMLVANRLASLFIEEVTQSREAQVEGASDFIQTQLDEARRELETQEEAVRRYKQRNMGGLPQQLQTNLSTLSRLQLEQQTLGENLRGAQDRLTLLQSQPRGLSAGGGPPIYDPESELASLKAQLETLRGRYTDEHPDVTALLARIQRLERSVPAAQPAGDDPSQPSSLLAQARLEVTALKARRDDLDRRIAEVQAWVDQTPRAEQELATLTRDFQKLNENYLGLLNKKLDAQMAAKLERRWKGEHFKILDPAALPETHYYPNRLLFLLAGILAGLASGAALAMAAELMDDSVKNVRELEAVLPYPLVATVAHIGLSRRAALRSGLWGARA